MVTKIYENTVKEALAKAKEELKEEKQKEMIEAFKDYPENHEAHGCALRDRESQFQGPEK